MPVEVGFAHKSTAPTMQARGEAVGIVGIPESVVWWLVEFR